MKRKNFKMAILATIITSMVCYGYESNAQTEPSKGNVDKAKVNLDEAKDDYKKQYAAFKVESEKMIATNEETIKKLRDDSREVSKEGKVGLETAITDLEKRNDAMRDKVKNYKEEDTGRWESFKAEFNHDMSEFGKAFKDIGVDNKK